MSDMARERRDSADLLGLMIDFGYANIPTQLLRELRACEEAIEQRNKSLQSELAALREENGRLRSQLGSMSVKPLDCVATSGCKSDSRY